MSNPNQNGQQITLSDAEKTVEIYDALQRLKMNRDFKTVFEEHLFQNEVIRLNALSAHPEMKKPEQADAIQDDLKAIANLKFQLQMIDTIGSNMKSELDAYRQAEYEAANQGQE
jgi:hypothetical protein